MDIRWLMVLTENDALVDPRYLRGLVDLAVTAEAKGVDGVMLSEHVLLGRDAGAAGRMANPRDYAAPGNQPGIRATFHGSDDVADLDVALADLPRQVDQAFTTICFKPAMFCRTVEDVPALCRRLVEAGSSFG